MFRVFDGVLLILCDSVDAIDVGGGGVEIVFQRFNASEELGDLVCERAGEWVGWLLLPGWGVRWGVGIGGGVFCGKWRIVLVVDVVCCGVFECWVCG